MRDHSSYLHGRAAVKIGAEIGLLSFRLSVSQDASLGGFPLAPVWPMGKVTLWKGFFYLTLGLETDEGVATDKGFAWIGNQTQDFGSKAQCAID